MSGLKKLNKVLQGYKKSNFYSFLRGIYSPCITNNHDLMEVKTMTYYKVKENCDNLKRVVIKNEKKVVDGILVKNELYTPSEFKKLANNSNCFEVVQVPKNKIYWFFGARFY